MSKNKPSSFDRLKSKYVFSFRPENNFLEGVKAKFTIFEAISILVLIQLLFFILFFLLIKFTTLKEFLGVNSAEQQQRYLLLEQRTDSLENVIQQNNYYYDTITKLINGENVDLAKRQVLNDDELKAVEISEPTQAELILRDSIMRKELYSLVQDKTNTIDFLSPVEGNISSFFEPSNEHFGIDITSEKNSPVLAIADGNVLYSSWNEKDGHTIILNHSNNYLSIYKHNKKVLKTTGDKVRQGDAIGIIGNSGENTTGLHLHFELWQHGEAKDPLDYLKLK